MCLLSSLVRILSKEEGLDQPGPASLYLVLYNEDDFRSFMLILEGQPSFQMNWKVMTMHERYFKHSEESER